MRYLVRLVFILGLLAGLAVVGYAYFGDLSAPRVPVEQPVSLPQN